jgi:serine O-acetyltransferase
MKGLKFYTSHLLANYHIKKIFDNYVESDEVVKKDISKTYELRGCDSKKTSDFDRFKHLMKYYPEFVFIFQWRTGLLDFRLKRLFNCPNYQCKIFKSTRIEGGLTCFHPFATVINAKTIGKNFEFRNGLTIGNKNNDNSLLPSIGNNVTVGANVCIIGHITIGHNVVIGAGSVVVKNVPDNVIVAGNPAKVIRKITE